MKNMQSVIREEQANISAAWMTEFFGQSLSEDDHLTRNDQFIEELINTIFDVRALAEPIGKVEDIDDVPRKPPIRRMTLPRGLLLIRITERPFELLHAIAMSVKAGNAVIVVHRGPFRTFVETVCDLFRKALSLAELPVDTLSLLDEGDDLTADELRVIDQVLVETPHGWNLIPSMDVMQAIFNRHFAYLHWSAEIDSTISNMQLHIGAFGTIILHEAMVSRFFEDCGIYFDRDKIQWIPETIDQPSGHRFRCFSLVHWRKDLQFAIVNSVEEAAVLIDTFGSGRTASIFCDSPVVAMRFRQQLKTQIVEWNVFVSPQEYLRLNPKLDKALQSLFCTIQGPLSMSELTCAKLLVGPGLLL